MAGECLRFSAIYVCVLGELQLRRRSVGQETEPGRGLSGDRTVLLWECREWELGAQ